MKKTYLLIFLLASLFSAKSQTLLKEDFESETFPPLNWTIIKGDASKGYNWSYNNDPNLAYVDSTHKPYPTFLGTGSMVYEADTIKADAWAITPSVSLKKGISYTISFYYRSARAETPEKLKVTVGTDATIIGQSTVLWNNNGSTGLANDSAWTLGTMNFVAAASRNFYFGFNCYSDPNTFALVVDNIKIEVTPATVPPCATRVAPANGAVNITAPQAFFTWTNSPSATETLFKIGKNNPPDSIGNMQGGNKYYSDLEYNTTYYWSVVPKNAVGLAVGCPVYSFTTQPAPPVPSNDDPAGAIAIAANETVSAYTKSATQTMAADFCNEYLGNANDDVWFTFTPLQSGSADITLTPDMIFDGVMDAYSGTPGSFVSLACADQTFEGEQEVLTLPDLTAGKTYYFRVYGFGDAGKDGSFRITASGITLPVNITSFKGERSGPANILTWTTLSEQNNKGFELQRSANGKDFGTIAFIASAAYGGNSSSALNYTFADAKAFAGNTYYRLKQIDKDGRSKTTNIVLLKGSQTNALTLANVYPNPAKSLVNINVRAAALNRINITLTDLAGRPVMQQTAQVTAGDNNLSLNVNKLPSGSYIIKAVCANGGETAVSKFVKQ